MTLAPKSIPLQDDRFILQMFILLQVPASPAVPIWKKTPPHPIFPPLRFIFLHVNILGDAEVDLFKLEGKTVQENSFFLYSILHFCPLKSSLCVFLQSSSLFASSIAHLYFQRLLTLVTFFPHILLSVFIMNCWVSRQSYRDVIKWPLWHLCSV